MNRSSSAFACFTFASSPYPFSFFFFFVIVVPRFQFASRDLFFQVEREFLTRLEGIKKVFFFPSKESS